MRARIAPNALPAWRTSRAPRILNGRTGLPLPTRLPPRRTNQKGAQSFQWNATDKNQDVLRYDVHYRGEAEREWKLLKDDLDETFLTIESDTLPDGKYILFAFQRYDDSEVFIYYVSYADIGTGKTFEPIVLPDEFFSTPREKPQAVLRSVE